jgi:serine/threonine protein kinase
MGFLVALKIIKKETIRR